MARKLTDVDALFLGTDEVERMFIGDRLIWNGDYVPELQNDPVYYDGISWSPFSTLGNQGTLSTDFDLPVDGTGLLRTREFPGLLPGDYAYLEVREGIDPSVLGVPPRSAERLVTKYPYKYDAISNLITVNNVGWDGDEGDITAEASNAFASLRSIKFPGVSTNYIGTLHDAAFNIPTSIEITFQIAPTNPDNRVGNQRIVAKSGTARSYEVWIGFDTQHGTLGFTRDGVSTAVSTEKIPTLPEHPMWFRVTYNSTTSQTKFYWAPAATSEPSTWTQLGATVTTVTGAIVSNTESLKVGTYNGTGDMFRGRLYNMIIRNADVAGTVVYNIDVAANTTSMTQDVTTTFTSTSGHTVTLVKSGTPPNTVRVMPAGTDGLADGGRFGYPSVGADFNELHNDDLQMQLFWVRMNMGGYSNAQRNIWPILRVANGDAVPYGNNSWGIYLDTFQAQIHMAVRDNSTDQFSEIFTSGQGVLAGSGNQVFFVAAVRKGANTTFFLGRYDPFTGAFVYPTGTSGLPKTVTVAGAPVIDTTTLIPNIQLWQGVTGATMTSAGIALFDNIIDSEELVGWVNSDVNIRDIVRDHLRAVALGLTPQYTVGEYWQATDDGTLEFAPEPVEEGDIFAVMTTAPTFQQIKFNHPSRRKTLYRPRYVTFGPPADPISVTAPEDFFIWVVTSAYNDNQMDNYITWGEDTVGNSFMTGDIWNGGPTSQTLYMEIDDDASDFGFVQLTTAEGLPQMFQRGHSSPTLMAMAIDKNANVWKAWTYDAENGLRNYANQSNTAGTQTWNANTLNMDTVYFFGPELGEGYNDSIWWGGGWKQGVGIAPTDDQVVEYWERAVYGYPQD
jgi:hypothetical protein